MGRLVQARTRKLIWSPNHARKNSKIMLGLKNFAMLPSYFDYIFVHLKQKARLRPDLSLKWLSTSGPNPIGKARPDLQLYLGPLQPVCSVIRCQKDASRLELTGSTAQPLRCMTGWLIRLSISDIYYLWLVDWLIVANDATARLPPSFVGLSWGSLWLASHLQRL